MITIYESYVDNITLQRISLNIQTSASYRYRTRKQLLLAGAGHIEVGFRTTCSECKQLRISDQDSCRLFEIIISNSLNGASLGPKKVLA